MDVVRRGVVEATQAKDTSSRSRIFMSHLYRKSHKTFFLGKFIMVARKEKEEQSQCSDNERENDRKAER